MPGSMHDPWAQVSRFLYIELKSIIHECIPVHGLVHGIIVCNLLSILETSVETHLEYATIYIPLYIASNLSPMIYTNYWLGHIFILRQVTPNKKSQFRENSEESNICFSIWNTAIWFIYRFSRSLLFILLKYLLSIGMDAVNQHLISDNQFECQWVILVTA